MTRSYKDVSTYYDEDRRRTATVRLELGTKNWVVSLMNDSGSAFSATFETEEDAEQYAEDWVVND